jgi:hypothetical protein
MAAGRKNAFVALVLGWVVPGGGHVYLGQVKKGLFFFVLLAGAFVGGIAIGGYDDVAFPKPNANTPANDITSRAMYRIIPAIQAMDGAVAFVSAKAAEAAERDNEYLGDYDIGVLYTVVAGLMNLIVMLDAFCLAAARRKEGSG